MAGKATTKTKVDTMSKKDLDDIIVRIGSVETNIDTLEGNIDSVIRDLDELDLRVNKTESRLGID